MELVKTSKRLFSVNAASGLFTHLLQISVLVWVQQFLVRRIPADEYALVPLLGVVAVLLPMLSSVITGGVARFVTHRCATGDHEGVTAVISSIYPLVVILVAFLLLAGGVFVWQIDRVFRLSADAVGSARIIGALVIGTFCVRILAFPFQTGLRAYQRFVLINIMELAGEAIRVVILLSLLLCVSTNVVWLAVSQMLGALCVSIALAIVSVRTLPCLKFKRRSFSWSIARQLTSFGGWMLLGRVGEAVYRSADPVILNRFANPVELVIFHLGTLVFRHLGSLLQAVFGPLQPVIVALYARGNVAAVVNLFLRLGRLTLWFLGLFVGPACFLGRPAFALYLGAEKSGVYAGASMVMALSLLSLVPFLSVYGVGKNATASARIRGYSIIMFTANIANLGVTIYLVGVMKLGALGSALGSAWRRIRATRTGCACSVTAPRSGAGCTCSSSDGIKN